MSLLLLPPYTFLLLLLFILNLKLVVGTLLVVSQLPWCQMVSNLLPCEAVFTTEDLTYQNRMLEAQRNSICFSCHCNDPTDSSEARQWFTPSHQPILVNTLGYKRDFDFWNGCFCDARGQSLKPDRKNHRGNLCTTKGGKNKLIIQK